MTGWLLFLLLAGLVMLWLAFIARPLRALLQLVGTALFVAAAGYAWQGHPGLAGHPVQAQATKRPAEAAFADERKEWMPQVGYEAQVLDTADALIRNGDADYAAGIIRGALSRNPRSMMLWLGLGNALVHVADGAVTPAARFAYDRAQSVAPGHPAPRYFLGLAYALSGDLETADALWRALLAGAPPTAKWRAPVAIKLLLVERLRLSR